MHSVNRLLFYVLVMVFCAGAYVLSLPEEKVLAEKQQILEAEMERERLVVKEKDKAARNNRALLEDPEYMKLLSRDILNYYHPGEVVFNIQKEDASQE